MAHSNKRRTTIIRQEFHGFEALELRNQCLAIVVVPELGGKIVSLKSADSDREWLWKNPALTFQQAELFDSYTERHDTGGIDECFPSVDACSVHDLIGDIESLELPDHGELYSRPWTFMGSEIRNDGSAAVTLRHNCRTLPCTFERTLTLPPGNGPMRLDYKLTNRSASPIPFSWCIHPELAIAPGMRILMPDKLPLYCSYATENAPVNTGEFFTWPRASSGIDLSVVPHNSRDEPFAAKLLSAVDTLEAYPEIQIVTVGLEDPDTSTRLLMTMDPREVPHIALWLNCRGWTPIGGEPYFNLVLEPAIGNADSLEALIQRQDEPTLPAKGSRSWSLEIQISGCS